MFCCCLALLYNRFFLSIALMRSHKKTMVMAAMISSMRKVMVTPTKAAVSRQSASGEVKLTTTWSVNEGQS